ncbi:lipopolysaccharide biosynthesis protein [Bacteroides clarus]|uniref:lipopolysaccharide biosynthesis protein n=1 Tax=Bacteroides clarus TaxID=626929 RepID=UPI002A82D2A8|nr:lipopolysaccharide biosynthesis protein [Bacteroides clarus]
MKSKTVSGVLWSAVERFSLQGVQFVINILMARLLLPSDYGMIGMLAVFLQISQTFVDSGFSDALVQKKDRTETDLSTVFYFNIVISVLLYVLLFIGAPYIAQFYRMPELTLVARIIMLNLIFSSFTAVPKTILTIRIDFRTQSKISLISAIISGVVGIIMAYKGTGVWALVAQTLLNAILITFLFFCCVNWRPLRIFSKASFQGLFSFGSKLLFSRLIHALYYNLYAIVIGRQYSSIELGYYTRAEQFAIFPSGNINAIISRVTFPILSSIQDDDKRLALAYRKYIRLASFLIFPLMIGLAAIAEPLVSFLLTAKWSGIVILLQILCLDWMLDHLSQINLNLLLIKGRSDLSLRLEIIKKIIATFILIISIPYGIEIMCWGRVLYSVLATYMNSYYTNRLIGLSFKTQMRDVFPSLLLAVGMGITVHWSISIFSSDLLKIIGGSIIGIIFYVVVSIFLKIEEFKEFVLIIKK